MPHRPRRRAHAALAAVAAAGVLLTTGCSEPAPTQTAAAEVSGGAIGPDVQVSADVGLRQVQLAYPADGVYSGGEEARLEMAITNTGSGADRLLEVRGPGFTGVRGAELPLAVPAGDTVYLGPAGAPELVLTGLRGELRSSQSTPVTFVFEHAGTTTVDVVVAADRPAVPGPSGDA